MPRSQISISISLPILEQHLSALTVDELKWYAAVVANHLPTRKGELIELLAVTLRNPVELRRLLDQCTPIQRQVVAEVVHNLGGLYDADRIEARYPGASAPANTRGYGGYYTSFGLGSKRKPATAFDLLFGYSYELGRYIPRDLVALLRDILPPPPPFDLHSRADRPAIAKTGKQQSAPPEVTVSTTERAVFHDLAATLSLIDQGKVSVSAATRLPNLTSLRNLRQRLLVGDYFPDQEYERAEDAIRPLALIILVQAAKWAAPASSGGKLELTRSGAALVGVPLEASHIRDIWQRWIKSNVLDELSRIRAIKGQQSKSVHLTKPAERREKLNAVLRLCPVDRWVEFDELLRYMRAEAQLPEIERNGQTALRIGSFSYDDYEWPSYSYGGAKYWDVVIGSYLRAVLWEYAATLGLIEIAYTWPEETPHDFGTFYGFDDDYVSRYDGLLGLRLTNLGAFVLGLTDEYTPPPMAADEGPPLLKVLPNLDIVVTDPGRIMPAERAFLERIGTAESQDVYRLSRDQVLEATQHGLSVEQIKAFLAGKSGLPEAQLPQTVRVFFQDLQQRLGALREGGKMLMLEGDDPYILTELANASALRSLVQLASIDGRTVLLVPEERESAVRRHLRKLGYVPQK
jgi:hypothetical protein